MHSTISNLKTNFIKFEKNHQNKLLLVKSLLWSYNQDVVEHFNQEMISLNQKIKQQFGKSFPFEFRVEQTQIQQDFPLQSENHQGLFFHLT
jgi:hypothetical protein